VSTGNEFPRGCVVSGIAQSETGRRVQRDPLALTLDAALEAIADAGLAPTDIDGIASYPGASPYLFDVKESLDLRLDWYQAGAEGPAQMGPVLEACMAVATGQARNVLVVRTVQLFGGGLDESGNEGLAGATSWQRPFGLFAAANLFALAATRFLTERALTREHLASIAINGRRNAADNPRAVFRSPLSRDEYRRARMISTPLCLYDCDAPCTGSIALVITAEPPPGLAHPLVRFEAMAGPAHGRAALDQFDRMALWDAATQLWQRTTLRPADVDVAQLYDGFSTITLEWLEALGFCAPGRVVELLEDDGAAIGRAGRIPLNTGGGMLSGGRIHGFLPILEACIQLRGEGGDRQVRPDPGVAVVGLGGGPIAGAMLLVRDG
jgi:acetyl-CoA acetyltransferase